MKINNTVLCWLLIVIAIITPLLGAAYIHYQRNNFSCEIHSAIVDDNSVVDVIMNYTLNQGVGNYESSGEYIAKGKDPIAISNKITFHYWREADRVIMISDETNSLPKRVEAYRSYIPDFFQQRDRGISLQITRANTYSYLFIYGGAPIFYCSKN